MMGLWWLYAAQFRTSLAAIFQYRAALVIWLISQVLDPVVYLTVWSTVAVQTLASIMPFRWMVAFPVELLLGKLTRPRP